MLQQATVFGLDKGARVSGRAPFIAVHAQPQQSSSSMEQAKKRRAVVAWIVAAGLGLSAALCPLPRDLRLLELFPPGDQSAQVVGRIAAGWPGFEELGIDLAAFEATDLVDVTGLLSRYPDLPVDMLLAVVQTYGVADVRAVLESLLPTVAGSGGAFALVPAGSGSASLLPTVVALLDYIGQLPARAVGALSDVVATVLPAVLQSLGISVAPAIYTAVARVAVAAEAPPAAPIAAPDPATAEAPVSAAPDAGDSAGTQEVAVGPAPNTAAEPAQSQASTAPAATQSASTITNDGLLSAGSTPDGAGAAGLDGTPSATSAESTAGSSGSSQTASSSAGSEADTSGGGATTGGDASGVGGSAGADGSNDGGAAGGAG
jgi:hypothetical protein